MKISPEMRNGPPLLGPWIHAGNDVRNGSYG